MGGNIPFTQLSQTGGKSRCRPGRPVWEVDGGKCILQLRGVRPFLSDKYDITKHPNFKYTADADDKNAFDIEAFLSARLKLKPNEVCDEQKLMIESTMEVREDDEA